MMTTRPIVRVLAAACAAAATFVVAGAAHADSIQLLDGDTATVATTDISVTGCRLPVTRDGLVTVKRNGNKHLTPGAPFTLVTSSTSGNVSTVRSETTSVVPTTFDEQGKDSFSFGIRTTIGAAAATGTATVSVKVTQPGYDTMNLATFAVSWSCVTNTAPVATLGGVADGASYEYGSVPAATCTWADTEDGRGQGTLSLSALRWSAPGTGSQTASCRYTDTGGLTSTATATYAVVDTTGPTLGTVADVVAEATGARGATVSYDPPTASDSLDGSRPVTCAPASGSTFPLGATTVRCSAADLAGNTGTTSFTVTVRDTTAPAVTVPQNATVEATGPAGATHAYAASATDAVDGDVPVSCTPSGTGFALGTTTVTCSATDAAGNTGTGSFQVTVQDSTAPVLTVPTNRTAEATGPTGAVVSWDAATATDSVDGARPVDCDHASGDTFGLGDTTVTCTARDAAGNKGSASFTVTVQDTTAPVLTVPHDVTAEAQSARGAVVRYAASASDLVDGSVDPSCSPASDSDFALDTTTTVTCTAVDAHGNSASASFTVKVVDTTAPTLPAYQGVTAEATSPAGALVTYGVDPASDAVDGDVVPTCAPASGSTFGLGATTVTCTATDSHGNEARGTFAVTVRDTTPPAFAPFTVDPVEATGPTGAVVTFAKPAATDAVDTQVDVACDHASGATYGLGATTVACTGTDDSGNVGRISFVVNVVDTTGPVVATVATEPVEATGPQGAVYSWDPVTAQDTVDGAIGDVTCVPPSGSTFPLGVTTVTCSAKDRSGNPGSSSWAVNVVDTRAPVFGPVQNVAVTATSAAGATVAYAVPTATDVVSGRTAVTCTPPSGSLFPLGTTTVRCSTKDAAGNLATTQFLVTVAVGWSGVLAPVTDGGSYKLGSTIPVKFALTGASAGVTDLKATLWVRKVGAVTGGADAAAAVSTSAATTGNLFRWADGQYLFNLSTKPLTAGTYELRVDLGDGVAHTVTITLR